MPDQGSPYNDLMSQNHIMSQDHIPHASKSVAQTLQNRVTIRKFVGKPVSEEMLSTILGAARRSPTSSNMQTYSLIVVKNPQTKAKLAELAGGQQHVETCPVFVAFCADIYRLREACKLHGVEMNNSLELTLVSTVDASLVGQSAQTVAESLGLGVVMIGGVRNHPAEVAELLGLPKGVYVVYGMCLGWPDPEAVPPQKPRLPKELVIHEETYQTGGLDEVIKEHDAELAKHYENLGRNLDAAAWSGPIAKRLQTRARPELRATLEDLSFSFE